MVHQANGRPTVIFYTREFCPLCIQARQVLDVVCAEASVEPLEVDIDNPPAGFDRDELQQQYSDYVPVVTVDGVQHGFWRFDADQLRRALS